MVIKTIFFDSDGTLWNNQKACIKEFSQVLKELGHKGNAKEIWIQAHMGHPITLLKKILFKHPLKALLHAKSIHQHIEKVHHNIMKKAKPFINKKQFTKLNKQCNIIVITQNEKEPVQLAFSSHNFPKPKAIYAGLKTKKKEKILQAIKENSIKPKEILFITDTIGDILQAKNTGINILGVNWGLHKGIIKKETKKLHLKNYVGTINKPKEIEKFLT